MTPPTITETGTSGDVSRRAGGDRRGRAGAVRRSIGALTGGGSGAIGALTGGGGGASTAGALGGSTGRTGTGPAAGIGSSGSSPPQPTQKRAPSARATAPQDGHRGRTAKA